MIVLIVPGGNDVVVALDTRGGSAPDGKADQVFRLQRGRASRWAGPASRPEAAGIGGDGLYLRNASVRWDGRSVQVRHPAYTAVLALANDPARPGAAGHRLTGHGVARARGEWPMTVAGLGEIAALGFRCGAAGSASLVPASGPSADSSQPVCTQGGPGSTSCYTDTQDGTCSVLCYPGYYACCSYVYGCSCVADPEE